jgi:hypothetical protein
MKRQVLLISFVLAICLNVKVVSGQNISGPLSAVPAPKTITCLTSDALHPIAGTEYTYQVTVPNPLTS